jgi:hypothetical protein
VKRELSVHFFKVESVFDKTPLEPAATIRGIAVWKLEALEVSLVLGILALVL